jgi:hypothetical protein
MWLPVTTGGSVLSRPARRAKMLPICVHAHLAAGLARPAREKVAALAVEVGQRDAADAALLGGAERRQFHQRVPEALAVDAELGL